MFEEIRELRGQAHQSLEDRNQLKEEATHWETHSRHLHVLLDQKEAFLQDLLRGPNNSLLYNLVKGAQYWNDRHAHLVKFVGHALEDLPGLLKKAYADMFPHNTLWAIFHFVLVCRVVFERINAYLLVVH